MAEKFQNRYRISSARAQWHDYNEGVYFITICTAHHAHFFGDVRDGDMHLNQLGMKAHENLQHLTDHYPYAIIDVFQVMPNHVHLIVYIDKPNDSDRNIMVTGCDDYVNSVRCNEERNVVRCDDGCGNSVRQNIERNVVRCDDCGNSGRCNDEPNVVQCDDCRDAARHVSTGKTRETDETRKTPKSDIMRDIANKRGLLSVSMGGFKSAITRYANDHNIPFGWQTRFHDHIIRDADEYERIAIYIENNPKTWERDKFNM